MLQALRPLAASTHGSQIDASVDAALLGVAAVFVVALASMILALARGRRRAAASARPGQALPAGPSETRRSQHVKLGLAVLLFAGLDAPMLLRSAGALAGAPWSVPPEVASDPRALRMQVLARQWTWEGRFPGADGLFATADDVVTRGELRVPAERPVILQMSSADVVHSLHAAGLRIQRDIVPGHLAQAWFVARSPGLLDVRCAQFCGASHAVMAVPLQVLSPDEHAAWLEEASDRALRESHGGAGRDGSLDAPGWGWPWREMAP